jgi:ethanolamine utilization protein EutQ
MATPTNDVFVFHSDAEELKPYDYGQPVRVTVWQPLEGRSDSLGAGTVTYEGRFDWEFKYDIAYYVLDGRLILRSNSSEQTAEPGDIVVIHRGASVTFEAPERCRAFWALYPSDWLAVSDLAVEDATGSGVLRLVKRG